MQREPLTAQFLSASKSEYVSAACVSFCSRDVWTLRLYLSCSVVCAKVLDELRRKGGHLLLFFISCMWNVCASAHAFCHLFEPDNMHWLERIISFFVIALQMHITHNTVTATAFDLSISEDYQLLKLFVCTAHKQALTFNSCVCACWVLSSHLSIEMCSVFFFLLLSILPSLFTYQLGVVYFCIWCQIP